MDGSTRLAAIREALESAFRPLSIEIVDESHLHRGHAGALSGRGHFRLRITAAAFDGRSPVARHRMVYGALEVLMETEIHALSIEALSPND
ncbi:MAG: BolA family transcriptional regulator [Gammaproteobacteria bacterium]|nr:BolA family transcriptional regulator [Gammaproteobacteria bacterium]